MAKAHQAARQGRDAARLDLTATEESIAYEVTRAYIGLKQASAAVEIRRGPSFAWG